MQMHGGSITQCVVVSIGQTAYVYSVLRSFLSVSRCQMCAVWPGLAIRPVMPKPPLREHRFRPLHCVLCICVYVSMCAGILIQAPPPREGFIFFTTRYTINLIGSPGALS